MNNERPWWKGEGEEGEGTKRERGGDGEAVKRLVENKATATKTVTAQEVIDAILARNIQAANG